MSATEIHFVLPDESTFVSPMLSSNVVVVVIADSMNVIPPFFKAAIDI